MNSTENQVIFWKAHLCQQQEVIEQEAVELLAALGFEKLPAVEELPGTQTVGDRVKHQLLKNTEISFISLYSKYIYIWYFHTKISHRF